MWSWRNLCKTTIFLMVDNVSSHQSLWWEIVFFVKKICYNLTVYVTLYYTLANIDPYVIYSVGYSRCWNYVQWRKLWLFWMSWGLGEFEWMLVTMVTAKSCAFGSERIWVWSGYKKIPGGAVLVWNRNQPVRHVICSFGMHNFEYQDSS